MNETENKENDLIKHNSDISLNEMPEQVKEAIQSLPPEFRTRIQESLSFTMSMMTRPNNPLEKITTPEHLHKIIENIDKDSDRDFKDRKGSRNFNLLVLIVTFIFIIVLICLLAKSNAPLLSQILTGLFGFAAGAFSGYGYRASKD